MTRAGVSKRACVARIAAPVGVTSSPSAARGVQGAPTLRNSASVVKMDRLHRDAMHLSFRLSQRPKNGQRAFLNRRWQLAGGNDLLNLTQVAFWLRLCHLYSNALSPDALIAIGFHFQTIATQRKRSQTCLQALKRKARIKHRPQQHIPADPRKTIKIGQRHPS